MTNERRRERRRRDRRGISGNAANRHSAGRARPTLRTRVVLLPRVIHVLELDQDHRLGVDGGTERGRRGVASREARLALASPLAVLADARAPALLALGSLPPVLADTPAPALLAPASPRPVLADARAPALLARASHPPVFADARAPALLARFSLPPVFADARAPALLAVVSLPPVLADPLPRALLAEVPSLALAVHARLAAPCPPGLARTLPEGWGHGGTRDGL